MNAFWQGFEKRAARRGGDDPSVISDWQAEAKEETEKAKTPKKLMISARELSEWVAPGGWHRGWTG